MHAIRTTGPRLTVVTTALGLGALVSGCATSILTSTAVSDFKAPAEGLAYAPPKAQLEVVAERKTVTAKEVADAKKQMEESEKLKTEAVKLADETKSTAEGLTKTHAAAEEPGKTELLKQLTIARAVAATAAAQAEVVKAKAKKDADEFERLSRAQGNQLETVTLKFLDAVPDPGERYVVNRAVSLTRDDDIKVKIVNGLLDSSESTSTDRTADVLISLAQTISARGAAQSMRARTDFSIQLAAPAAAKPCNDFKLTYRFDPTLRNDVAAVARQLYVASQGAMLLFVSGVDLAAEGGHPLAPPAPTADAQGLVYRGLKSVSVYVTRLHTDAIDPRLAGFSKADVTPPGALDTACAKAELKAPQLAQVVASGLVPDASTRYLLRSDAGAFTTSTVKHVFKAGIPVEMAINMPSQLAAIVKLPVNMLKAVMQIPAEIIQLRINQETANVNLLKQQVDALNQQVLLLNAQKALEDRLAQQP